MPIYILKINSWSQTSIHLMYMWLGIPISICSYWIYDLLPLLFSRSSHHLPAGVCWSETRAGPCFPAQVWQERPVRATTVLHKPVLVREPSGRATDPWNSATGKGLLWRSCRLRWDQINIYKVKVCEKDLNRPFILSCWHLNICLCRRPANSFWLPGE